MSEWKETELGKIPDNWSIKSASKFCIKVTDGTHDSPKQKEKGFPLITSKHIKGDEINFADAYLISKEDYDDINQRSKVHQWDVIISMIGEYCGFSYIEENEKVEYAIKNVGLFKPKNELDSKWLYYYLQGRQAKHYINFSRTGTSQPYITLSSLRDFPILIPSSEAEKMTIVKINDCIRSKITLLRQQNQDLEELAQTLFKRWFVEFEFPVELKGKKEKVIDCDDDENLLAITSNFLTYKSSGGKMVESELGEIPEGWRVGKLSELLEIKYGKDHKHLEDGRFPLYGSGGIMRFVEKALYDKPSILIPRKGTLTNIYYLEQPFWSVDTMFYSKIRKSNYGKYCYQLLKRVNFSLLDVGSAIPSLTTELLNEMDILMPDEVIVSQFENSLSSLFNKLNFNTNEIQTLTQLRDTLLPKLMSGELRVNI